MKTSGMTRALYGCPAVPLPTAGPEVRRARRYSWRHVLFSPCVGVERDGVVYELFVSTLPTKAVTASDVLDLYLHRGSFETALADEDDEQESDRWYGALPLAERRFAQILAKSGVEPPPGTGADALSRLRYARAAFASAYVAEPVHADEPAELAENMAHDDPALRAIRSSTVPKTERETDREPHRMADDFWRETKTFVIGRNAVCFHKAILAECSAVLPS